MVAVGGELDLYSAPELKLELLQLVAQGARWVVVDLTDTTYIDSTSLGVLLGAVKHLRPSDGELVIVCSDQNIRKIFEITLLDRVLRLYDTLPDALATRSGSAEAGGSRSSAS